MKEYFGELTAMLPGINKKGCIMAIEEKKDLLEQIKRGANEIVKRVDALSEMKSNPSYDMLLLGTLEYCEYLGRDLCSCIEKADSDLKDSLSIINKEIPF